MRYKSSIKLLVKILLVTYISVFIVPSQEIAYAKQVDDNKNKQEQIQENNENYEKEKNPSDDFQEIILQKIDSMIDSVDEYDIESAKNTDKEIKTVLEKSREEIRNQIDKDGEIINDAEIKQKQDDFKNLINAKFDYYESTFDEINILLDSDAVENTDKISDKLDEIKKEFSITKVNNNLQAGELSHKNVEYQRRDPVIGQFNSVAYSGNSVLDEKSALSKEPDNEDISENTEIKFSDEIKAKADSLSSAVDVYEYVRNNIRFESYYGSRKGSDGTIQEMSGNDFDQASLLIAMLRYKKIPARYVRGTIELSADDVKAFTGTSDVIAAARVLSSGGIPAVCVTEGGVVTRVRFEHTWTEAYIPYENYRGIGENTGESMWIPLDPSFKKLIKKDGMNITDIEGNTKLKFTDNLNNVGMISKDGYGFAKVDTSDINKFIIESKNNIQNYSEANIDSFKDKTLNDIAGGYDIIPENLGLLPCTLPYETVSLLGEYQEIPDTFRDKITFTVKEADPYGLNFDGSEGFSYSVDAIDLYGKNITLSWIGATEKDESVLEKYGGIFKTPAYMVQLKPVLKVDGDIVAEGNPVGMGYRQKFTMKFNTPGQPVGENIENIVTAGAYYCIGLDYGIISQNKLNNITEKLKNVKSICKDNFYSDEGIGQVLDATIKSYFTNVDFMNKIAENQYNVSATRLISEGICGYKAKVSYMFNVPFKISEGSLYVDIDRNVETVISRENNDSRAKEYVLLTGIYSSNMEHQIFEDLYNIPSVSTIKVLAEANKTGVPVYSIDKKNIDEIMPNLKVDDNVKEDVRNAVNSGKIVTIPQRNIQYYNWSGTGYLILDSDTGSAAYMISGGTNG